MIIKQIRIDPYDTLCVVDPSIGLTAGTYLYQVQTRSNYILSSIFIEQIGAGSVTINWWQTTTGNPTIERQDLVSHGVFTAADSGSTNTIAVTDIHNKPIIEIVVSGGPAKIGSYVTALPGFGSRGDRSLGLNGQTHLPEYDLGMISAGLDPVANELRFLTVDSSGALLINPGANDASSVLQGQATLTNAVPTAAVISASVPAGFRWRILGTFCRSTTDTLFELLDDGLLIGQTETTFEERVKGMHDGITVPVETGSALLLRATSKSWTGQPAQASAIVYLKEESI